MTTQCNIKGGSRPNATCRLINKGDMVLGKVYAIRARLEDGNLSKQVYIGSTHNSISSRLAVHKSQYKRYLEGKAKYIASVEVIKLGEPEIEVLEMLECLPSELKEKEAIYMKEATDAVNRNLPGKKDMKEYHRAYYQANKDKVKARYEAKKQLKAAQVQG
jgi:hypothetical protein